MANLLSQKRDRHEFCPVFLGSLNPVSSYLGQQ